jgi:hypothetical protein
VGAQHADARAGRAVRRAGQVVEVWATQIDTIGGSSDTEVNELAIALAMWNARCG